MLHHPSSFIFFIISYVFIWTHLLSFTQKKVSTDFPPFSLSKVQLFGTFSKMRGAAIFLRPQMLVGLNESAAGCTHGFSRCWSGSHGRTFFAKKGLKRRKCKMTSRKKTRKVRLDDVKVYNVTLTCLHAFVSSVWLFTDLYKLTIQVVSSSLF